MDSAVPESNPVSRQARRPVATPIPCISVAEGLPPIEDIPLRAAIGLLPEQMELLRLFLRGRDVALTAPGGSGKTTLIYRYIVERKAITTDASIYVLSVDPNTSLKEVATIFTPDRWSDLIRETVSDGKPVNRRILIIDEFVALSMGILDNLALYGQLIITGDLAQGAYGRLQHLIRCVVTQRRATHVSLSTIWRSNNGRQFALANAIIYGGRHDAMESAASQIDSVRSIAVSKATMAASAFNVAARIARLLKENHGFTVSLIASSKSSLAVIFAHLAGMFLEHVANSFTVVHPAMLNGVETDIAIVAPSLLGRPTCPVLIEQLAVLLVGRTKFRLELCHEFLDDGTPEPLSLFLSQMLGWRYDTIVNPDVEGPLSKLGILLRTRGLMLREARSHLLVLERESGKPVAALNPVGPTIRETMHRRAALVSLGWKVKECILRLLQPPFYEEQSQEVRETLEFIELARGSGSSGS